MAQLIQVRLTFLRACRPTTRTRERPPELRGRDDMLIFGRSRLKHGKRTEAEIVPAHLRAGLPGPPAAARSRTIMYRSRRTSAASAGSLIPVALVWIRSRRSPR